MWESIIIQRKGKGERKTERKRNKQSKKYKWRKIMSRSTTKKKKIRGKEK